MKRIISLLLSIIMCITLIGCSTTEQEKSDNNINAKQTKNNDLGLDIDEIGDCTFYITTGDDITSENGAIPYIYLQDENTVMQIGYVAEGFDGSKLSYIYIDGELAQKETLSKDYQGTINLENDTIKFGKHKVEVVQYKDSESKNKEDIEVYQRRISSTTVRKSLGIFFIGVFIALFGTLILSIVNPEFTLLECSFEVISAFATVGLSIGGTPSLTALGKILIMILMFLGRVGSLTIFIALLSRNNRIKSKIRYAEGKIIVG